MAAAFKLTIPPRENYHLEKFRYTPGILILRVKIFLIINSSFKSRGDDAARS